MSTPLLCALLCAVYDWLYLHTGRCLPGRLCVTLVACWLAGKHASARLDVFSLLLQVAYLRTRAMAKKPRHTRWTGSRSRRRSCRRSCCKSSSIRIFHLTYVCHRDDFRLDSVCVVVLQTTVCPLTVISMLVKGTQSGHVGCHDDDIVVLTLYYARKYRVGQK